MIFTCKLTYKHIAIATGQHTIFHNVCQGSAVCGKILEGEYLQIL